MAPSRLFAVRAGARDTNPKRKRGYSRAVLAYVSGVVWARTNSREPDAAAYQVKTQEFVSPHTPRAIGRDRYTQEKTNQSRFPAQPRVRGKMPVRLEVGPKSAAMSKKNQNFVSPHTPETYPGAAWKTPFPANYQIPKLLRGSVPPVVHSIGFVSTHSPETSPRGLTPATSPMAGEVRPATIAFSSSTRALVDFGGQIKSFSDSPPMAWVHSSIHALR